MLRIPSPAGTECILLPVNYRFCVGFEVLTATVTKIVIFWDIAPCKPYIWTDVSEERITSIFKVENQPSKKTAVPIGSPAKLDESSAPMGAGQHPFLLHCDPYISRLTAHSA
jgi:hypothetical protein